MKNTKANVVKLLNAYNQNLRGLMSMYDKHGEKNTEKYRRALCESITIDDVIWLLTDNDYFNRQAQNFRLENSAECHRAI